MYLGEIVEECERSNGLGTVADFGGEKNPYPTENHPKSPEAMFRNAQFPVRDCLRSFGLGQYGIYG